MTFLIRTIDTTADGREIVRDREVAEETITIGRRSDNDIHLPDLAVEQYHARIDRLATGKLRIDSAGTLGFTLDGKTIRAAQFHPEAGAELGFGSYRLAIAQGGGGVITITVQRASEQVVSSDALSGFSLGGKLPGKRAMAWIGLGLVLLAFLIVPITSNLSHPPTPPKAGISDGVLMDASWSPGALSLAHHGLEDNCQACHVKPFQSVRDTTCLSCHKDIGHHAAKSKLSIAEGPMSLGDKLQWNVAEAFGKEGPQACTTCHREHEGAGRMEPTPQKFCSDCHGTLDTRLTDTSLGNAADFGTAHPQFEPVLFTAPGQIKPQRVSLDGKPKEFNGLRFPHEMHLSKTNAVAQMAGTLSAAKGYGAALDCSDCHKPTADGTAFKPISMEQDCGACHSLVYDKVGSTFRTLHHGDVEQMRADLMAMDRAPHQQASNGLIAGRRAPGVYGQSGLYRQNFGPPVRSLVAINRAMQPDGVCGECHIPVTTNGKLDVMPVNIPDHYLVHSWFDHSAHKQEKCTTCHQANLSKSATDVLLPGIKTCRTCHMGPDDAAAEVPSSCAMCHSYHPGTMGDPQRMLPAKNGHDAMNKVAMLWRKGP